MVALALATMAAAPTDGSSGPDAVAFVRHLYDRYQNAEKVSSPTGADAPNIFDPPLLALIRRDQAEAKGQTGRLDHDPICDCQDSGGLTSLRVSASEPSQGTAKATARFTISADKVEIGYKLVLTEAGWRVSDLGTTAMPSLRQFLAGG